MKKKMHPAKKYLLQYQKYDAMIENKKAEKEKWETIATSTTAQLSERVQTSSNGQKMTNAVMKIVKIQEELDECIVKAKNKQDEIIGVIEQLDAKEYDLLHKIYIQYYDLKQYQYMKHISYSSVTSIHGRALNKVWELVGKEDANEY